MKRSGRYIGLKNVWLGNVIEEVFRNWYTNRELEWFRALPFIVVWEIWLAKNFKLFENKKTLPLKCVVQALNIIYAFPWI
jgi:hypothetical protein